MMRKRYWLGGLLAGVLLLTGCGQGPASAAAVVGGQRIEMSQIDQQVRAINTALGRPAGQADADLAVAVVRNNIVYELVRQVAAETGVAATKTEIEERLADQLEFTGDKALLEQQAAAAGVAPDQIAKDVEVSLLAEKIGDVIAAGSAASPEDVQQRLIAMVQSHSEQAGVEVNPRYGVWDAKSLAVLPDPDAPSRSPQLAQLGQP